MHNVSDEPEKKAILGCIRKSTASRLRGDDASSALVRGSWNAGSSAGFPGKIETLTSWSETCEGQSKAIRRLDHLSYKDRCEAVQSLEGSEDLFNV